VPKTCKEYAGLGITSSGIYLIDPDGPGFGEPALTVTCNMTTGATVIEHDAMEEQDVEQCTTPGCQHEKTIKYRASNTQIERLKDISENCSQKITVRLIYILYKKSFIDPKLYS
jgi:hypothetical protein